MQPVHNIMVNPQLWPRLPYLIRFAKETKQLHIAYFTAKRTTKAAKTVKTVKTEVVRPGGHRLLPEAVVVSAP